MGFGNGFGNGTLEMGLWKWDFGNGTSVPSNKKELGLKSQFRKAEWWVLRPTSENEIKSHFRNINYP